MSDQQFRRDLICAALAGRSANYMRANGKSAALEAAVVIELADAALAAAGEQEPTTSDADAKWMLDKIDELKAENARLKRLLEPLTEEEERNMPRGLTFANGRDWDFAISTVKNRRA